jgi:predicted NBD/HSP70 family sugar kinase
LIIEKYIYKTTGVEMKGNSTGTIKEANKYLVFDALLKYDALTIEEIIRKAKLSRPTVLNILTKMMKDKIVVKQGFKKSESGRKPALFSINKQSHYSIGIDTEIPPVRLVIVDIKGNIVYSDKWIHILDDSIDNITDDVIQKISQSIINSNLNRKNIIGISIGIPGTMNVNSHKTKILLRAKEGVSYPMDLKIEKYFNIPVIVKNDSDCAARAEKENVNLKSRNNFIYISYRSGIGMSVFVEGKLYEGLGAPSYIGHTSFIPNGLPCECGNQGCLELYCSKPSIIKKYCSAKNLDISNVTYKEILDFAKLGDKVAIDILQESAECLGIRISDVIKLFDMHTVIIGGSECDQDSIFFKTIVKATFDHVFDYLHDDLEILLGSQDEFCPALGASLLVIDNYFLIPKLSLNV